MMSNKIVHKKKNLVIASVRDESYHKRWLWGRKRNFDLMLIYIGDIENKYIEDADYYIAQKGMFKLENIIYAVGKYKDAINNYDAVWLPDDDMIIGAKEINKLFNIFHRYNLDLAQPSILCGRSYDVAKTNPKYLLRFVNFIELGCPVFKTELLFKVLPFFKINRSGWGIGRVWSKYCSEHKKKMAIIDCVNLIHRNEWMGGYYQRLKSLDIDWTDELGNIEAEHKFYTEDIMELGHIKSSWLNYNVRKIERKIKLFCEKYMRKIERKIKQFLKDVHSS